MCVHVYVYCGAINLDIGSPFVSFSCRKDFEELFDIIITNALKPGFFSSVPHQRPFRTLGKYLPHAALTHFYLHIHIYTHRK